MWRGRGLEGLEWYAREGKTRKERLGTEHYPTGSGTLDILRNSS